MLRLRDRNSIGIRIEIGNAEPCYSELNIDHAREPCEVCGGWGV